MRRLASNLLLMGSLVVACGGPSADLPRIKPKGGSGGVAGAASGGTPSTMTVSSGAPARGGSATGGTTSTYTEPACPNPVETQFDVNCSVLDQATCPEGQACFPSISYPKAVCEPETYHTRCAPAGTGKQWDPCQMLTDCAPGFICVVGGNGTECERACDARDAKSCPLGLFCDAIDLPGIGTCY